MIFGVAVNWLAIIIASVASFILGWLWYGPLFGKMWLKGSGMNDKEAKKMHKEGMGGKMLLNFVGTLITAYVLANLIGVVSGVGVVSLALWVGIGFIVATSLLGDVLWKGRPWSFFLINAVYWIVNLILMGLILTAF